MFKRKIYEEMLQWKQLSAGSTALFIEGARRIGKSTIAETFAKNEYDDYLILDFAKVNSRVKSLFEESLDDLTSFFRNLFLFTGKRPKKGRMVIILDEVQLFPLARQAIKYLVQDGRYDYIETGSLISIKKNVRNILIPSEEYRIKMFPMDFDEFLWACGDEITSEIIAEGFNDKKPLGTQVHRTIMDKFRTYMAVGGMPQAVSDFVNGKNFDQIDFTKRNILSLYEDDLTKHDADNHDNASIIFKHIPEQLNRKKSIFKMSAINKNARYKNFVSSFSFIQDSMIGNRCVCVSEPDVALGLYKQSERFKLYMGDTGLLVSQIMKTQKKTGENIYQSLIGNKLGINQGMIFENVVAQMLRAKGYELFFHEFEYQGKGEDTAKNYEIDFLLVKGKRICPIEVKSSSYKQHKSFDCLRKKYQLKMNEKYILYTKDLCIEDGVTYLPLYMAGLI